MFYLQRRIPKTLWKGGVHSSSGGAVLKSVPRRVKERDIYIYTHIETETGDSWTDGSNSSLTRIRFLITVHRLIKGVLKNLQM